MSDWKEEIRKTIFRQLPGREREEMAFEGYPRKLNSDPEDLPAWEKTAQEMHEEIIFSEEEYREDYERELEKEYVEKTSPDDKVTGAGSGQAPKDSTVSGYVPADAQEQTLYVAKDEKDDKTEAEKEPEKKSADDIKGPEGVSLQAREWLFKENMRLEGLRSEVARAGKMMQEQAAELKEKELRLENEKKLFEKEKEEFRREMKQWNDKIESSKKNLGDQQALFDKKYKVLEMGFAKLNADRKELESQKRAFEYKKKFLHEADSFAAMDTAASYQYGGGDYIFFKGVSHPMAVKKRYKELIKIYHPDNSDGDKYILQRINQEYDRLRRAMQ